MIIVLTCVLAIAVIAFVLRVRPQDLPDVEQPSPFNYLDERKAAIYENLRDLQFEYRVGKLSDADYQNTKQSLQKELASVMAETDRLKASLNGNGNGNGPASHAAPGDAATAHAAPAKSPAGAHAPDLSRGHEGASAAHTCSACGAKFEKDLKFCGECGKPMKVAVS